VRRENSDEGYDQMLFYKGFDPDIEIPIYDPKSNEITKASFSVRPYLKEFLTFSNIYFEVGIFTAGNQWFADKIVDYLDPDDKFI
jgi:CTD small phosphatase-like protein 2